MGLLKDIDNEKKAKQGKLAGYSKEVKYCLQGLEILVEATAAAITSIYAIVSAHNNHMAHWAAIALTVAGSVVVLRAFVEYIKLLNRRG